MTMTRKDYKFLASVIKSHMLELTYDGRERDLVLVRMYYRKLVQRINGKYENFRHEQFLDAAGLAMSAPSTSSGPQ